MSFGRLRRAFAMAVTMMLVGADDGDVGRCVGAEVGSVMGARPLSLGRLRRSVSLVATMMWVGADDGDGVGDAVVMVAS